jgi:hypothetical protein
MFSPISTSRVSGDGAGVEPLVHLHHHHAGLFIAGHDRPLDRRGTAPARQQRGVAVVAAVAGAVEDRFRQQQAVGDDDGDIGLVGGETLALLRDP